MAGNLTRDEARERGRLLTVESYAVELDLTTGPERFGSVSVVRFGCAEPGADVHCDLADATVREITLNGRPVGADGYDPVSGRIALSGLAADNELRVVADCAYSRSGQGLHRFTDPVDGGVYLWSQAAPADAQRMFACFDQPDLKAPLRLAVTAPASWQVASNGAGRPGGADGDARRWEFDTTPPLPTYLAAVMAGPYHVVTDEYLGRDGQRIPLRLLCRGSLAGYLDVDEILDTTRRGFDFYQRAFGVPYPFDTYDQCFVPEMESFAAMENAGCVTFRESYIFRSKVTDADRERRANTILHEMAHMWFGDLVTMRWWDDTWLNESFATYAASLAQVSATRWTGAWATFADRIKALAYRQDQLPSTHPISADIGDIAAMEVNFDGITYHKGASVLKQLVATVGQDDFLAALGGYFRRHAWGSATLTDLLAALEKRTGRDLSAWSAQWLRTCGPNTLHPEFGVADGRFTTFEVCQSAPAEHPTLRSHRIAIGLYDKGSGGLVRRRRVELEVSGERTEVAELKGVARPDVVLLNDDDLTYAKIRLDPESTRTVLDGIGLFADVLPQAVCWTMAWDMTRDGQLRARDYVRLVATGVSSVRRASIVRTLLNQARTAAERYTDPAWRASGLPAFAADLLAAARTAEPGGEAQLALAQAFTAVAAAPDQLDVVAGLLDGTGTGGPPGLEVDTDLRWALLRRLVAAGRADGDRIDAELARDATADGQRHAATCRAAIATPGAKAAAWDRITSGTQSGSMLQASLDGFAEYGQAALVAPYVARYFEALDTIAAAWPIELALMFADVAYPRTVATTDTVARTDAYLATGNPPAWLRRRVTESRDELARTLRCQSHDATGPAPADR